MRVVDLIAKKRQGGEHTDEEIQFLVQNYVEGTSPDYQMSAWMMAVLWRGLTEQETFALTNAMVASGDVLDLSQLPGTTLDKHSTGGVGDKTTLAVVPILASAGVVVAKMSGRGLGHTGGTLDKLESIPGFRIDLTLPEIMDQVAKIGACICGQTGDLVPADKKMYALRDATSTVESLPLIAASIMSKKLAGGSKAVLLDVKVGRGAFMKTLEDARALADLMVQIGTDAGRRVAAVLTDMERPLGYYVGNALEVREVVLLLQGDANVKPRLRELVIELAGMGFVLSGISETLEDGKVLAEMQIQSGAALEKLEEIIAAQGGDADALTNPEKQPTASVIQEIKATSSGYVGSIAAEEIGLAAMVLGAGRATKEDTIDPAAGIVLHIATGSAISEGDVLATLYTNVSASASKAATTVQNAIAIVTEKPDVPSLIFETVGI